MARHSVVITDGGVRGEELGGQERAPHGNRTAGVWPRSATAVFSEPARVPWEDRQGHREGGRGHGEDGRGHREDRQGHREDGRGHWEDGHGHSLALCRETATILLHKGTCGSGVRDSRPQLSSGSAPERRQAGPHRPGLDRRLPRSCRPGQQRPSGWEGAGALCASVSVWRVCVLGRVCTHALGRSPAGPH